MGTSSSRAHRSARLQGKEPAKPPLESPIQDSFLSRLLTTQCNLFAQPETISTQFRKSNKTHRVGISVSDLNDHDDVESTSLSCLLSYLWHLYLLSPAAVHVVSKGSRGQ